MSLISSFYGVQVHLEVRDAHSQFPAHVRVIYGGDEGVFGIESAEPLGGNLPLRPLRIVPGWIELHRDELMANWALAAEGRPVFNVAPLQ